MSFDGAYSKFRNIVGIVLMSADKTMHPHVVILEFPCANKKEEYKDLI
jgi:hypothetical protein